MASWGDDTLAGLQDVQRCLQQSTYSVALHPDTTDEFSNDIQSHLDASHGLDDADRNDKNKRQCDTVRDHAGRRVRRPACNTSKTESGGDDKCSEVPPFGDCEKELAATVKRVNSVDKKLASSPAYLPDNAPSTDCVHPCTLLPQLHPSSFCA